MSTNTAAVTYTRIANAAVMLENLKGSLVTYSGTGTKADGTRHHKLYYALMRNAQFLQAAMKVLQEKRQDLQSDYLQKDTKGNIQYHTDSQGKPDPSNPIITDRKALEDALRGHAETEFPVEFFRIPARWIMECDMPPGIVAYIDWAVDWKAIEAEAQ